MTYRPDNPTYLDLGGARRCAVSYTGKDRPARLSSWMIFIKERSNIGIRCASPIVSCTWLHIGRMARVCVRVLARAHACVRVGLCVRACVCVRVCVRARVRARS